MDTIDLVVNCSGLGARTLGGVEDKSVVAVRGQTILVKAKPGTIQGEYQLPQLMDSWSSCFTYRCNEHLLGEPQWASFRETVEPWSIIPRGDGIYYLNGTYDTDNYSLEPDAKVAENIWQRCLSLRPQWLEGAEVVAHQVGLRPKRAKGPRVELERRVDGKAIIHNYGHGGDGVVLSWGCAAEVCEILRSYATQAAKHSKL